MLSIHIHKCLLILVLESIPPTTAVPPPHFLAENGRCCSCMLMLNISNHKRLIPNGCLSPNLDLGADWEHCSGSQGHAGSSTGGGHSLPKQSSCLPVSHRKGQKNWVGQERLFHTPESSHTPLNKTSVLKPEIMLQQITKSLAVSKRPTGSVKVQPLRKHPVPSAHYKARKNTHKPMLEAVGGVSVTF